MTVTFATPTFSKVIVNQIGLEDQRGRPWRGFDETLSGAEDGPNFPALAKRTADAIPGAQLILIPKIGHNPHMEAPELFYPRLLEFLKDSGGSENQP